MIDRHVSPSDSQLRRIRWLVALFIVGLVFSGATAIPIETEVNWLVQITGAREQLERPSSTTAPAWPNGCVVCRQVCRR